MIYQATLAKGTWWIYVKIKVVFVVQLSSHVQHSDPIDRSMSGLSVPHHLLEFAQVHVHCISDVQPSHSLMPSSSALNLSWYQGLFQWVICSHQMTKILEFQLSISPSSEYSALISLKIDWFDLAVQGIFRSLLQHHSLKAWIRWCSAFFMVQLSQSRIESKKLLAIIRQKCMTKFTKNKQKKRKKK